MAELKQKSSLSFALNIVNAAIGYLSLYFTSRYLGPVPLGLVAAAMSFVSLFNIIGELGFSLVHVKKVAEGMDFGKCNGAFMILRIISTFLMGLVVYGAYTVYPYIYGKPYLPEEYKPVFNIILISLLLSNLTTFFGTVFNARTEIAKSWAVLLVQRVTATACSIYVAVHLMSAIELSYANLISISSGFVIAIILFRKYPLTFPDKTIVKGYLAMAAPMSVIVFVDVVVQNLDKVIITLYSSPEQTGYYSAGQSVVQIVNFTIPILITLLLPTYTRLHAEGKTKEIGEMASKVEKYSSLMLMPVGVFLFIFSVPVGLLLLGNKFAHTAPIISWLGATTLITIFSRPYTSQLIAINKTKTATILGVAYLFLNIILYSIFIPTSIFGVPMLGLGGLGAAVSNALSVLIISSIFRFYAFKYTRASFNIKVLYHLVCAVVAYELVKLFYVQHDHLKLLYVALYFTAGLAVYTLLLYLIKELKKEDIMFYSDFFSAKKIFKYVKREIKE